ncbi:MAG: hypothetical protein HXX80_05590, partial [Nitrososphaerales archaeon]|nr:hypothetical protein [Nitrososphaerales archaeon]
MPKRRIKIEFDDGEGGKYSVVMEGSISRDKLSNMMNMVDLMEGKNEERQQPVFSLETRFGRLHDLIEKKFAFGSFTSTDVLEAYEDEYNTPAKLATISTYLQRLTERGLLTRRRTDVGWSYHKSQI